MLIAKISSQLCKIVLLFIATHHKINKDAFQGGADWQDSGVGENGEEFLGRTTRWKFAFRADGQILLGRTLAVFLGRGRCLLDEEAAWKCMEVVL